MSTSQHGFSGVRWRMRPKRNYPDRQPVSCADDRDSLHVTARPPTSADVAAKSDVLIEMSPCRIRYTSVVNHPPILLGTSSFRAAGWDGSFSTKTFSWVKTCGTLTENTKSSGVRAAQLLTVRAEGHA